MLQDNFHKVFGSNLVSRTDVEQETLSLTRRRVGVENRIPHKLKPEIRFDLETSSVISGAYELERSLYLLPDIDNFTKYVADADLESPDHHLTSTTATATQE
jgi:hypothetical protein